MANATDKGPESAPQATRLWEVDHPYYCNEGNYYSNECHTEFPRWQDFAEGAVSEDHDMNLIFRWDWKEGDDPDAPTYNGDDYYRNGTLQLFYMGQRKGLFRCVEVSVCRADELAVIEFLRPRWALMQMLWAPLSAALANPPVPQ